MKDSARNTKVDWEDEQEKKNRGKRKDLEGEKEQEIQDWTEKGHKSNKDRVMERNTGEDRGEKRREEEVWEKQRENAQGRREPERRSDGKRKETKVGRREGVCVWVSLSQQGVRLRNIMEKRWMERETCRDIADVEESTCSVVDTTGAQMCWLKL